MQWYPSSKAQQQRQATTILLRKKAQEKVKNAAANSLIHFPQLPLMAHNRKATPINW